MPLVTCPDCGKQMSDAAPSCPNCGRPNRGDTIPSPFGGATSAPPPPPQRAPWPGQEPARENRSNLGLIVAAAAFFGLVAFILFGLRKDRTAQAVGPADSAAVAAAADSSLTAIEDPKVVTASDGQSRMTVPGSWQEMPDLNDEAEIEVGNLFREQYAIVLTESKEDFSDAVDLDRFSQLVTQNLRDGLADASVTAPRPLTVRGRPAVQRVIRGSKDELRVVYWLTAVEGQRNYFQVLMWTLGSRADANEPVYQAVVNNFQEVVP